MSSPAPFELFAIKYAHFERMASENFIFQDIHDGPMPLDYFVWVARAPERAFVIDTGFSEATGRRKNRQLIRNPAEGLEALAVDPARVEDVIVTHMHYDHVGNFEIFPNATFHLQDREMAYATGRYMRHARLRQPFDVENVTGMVRELYRGRVEFHDGTDELHPGLTVHRVGGHSHGLQIVRVFTRRGWVVVASDATHFYAHLETGNPFPIVLHVGEMLEGHALCRRLAESEAHIVPGHDPLVMQRYPAPSPGLEGIAVRLDVPPAS